MKWKLNSLKYLANFVLVFFEMTDSILLLSISEWFKQQKSDWTH